MSIITRLFPKRRTIRGLTITRLAPSTTTPLIVEVAPLLEGKPGNIWPLRNSEGITFHEAKRLRLEEEVRLLRAGHYDTGITKEMMDRINLAGD